MSDQQYQKAKAKARATLLHPTLREIEAGKAWQERRKAKLPRGKGVLRDVENSFPL